MVEGPVKLIVAKAVLGACLPQLYYWVYRCDEITNSVSQWW